jgi:O-antigen ligase
MAAVSVPAESAALAVGFIAGVLAWTPLDAVVSWSALGIELAFVAAFIRRDAAGARRFAIPVVLLLLGLCIEALRASYQTEALTLLRSYFAVVGLYLLFAVTPIRWAPLLALEALGIGCTFAASLILYFWSGDPRATVRLLNTPLHALLSWVRPSWSTAVEPANLNAAAFLLATLAPLTSVAGLRGRGALRLISLGATTVLIAAVFLMSGRASWFGTAVGLSASAMFVVRRRRWIAVAALPICLIGLGLFATDTALAGRLDLWRLSIEMLLASFPLGVGLGTFPHLLFQALQGPLPWSAPTTPHNTFMQIAGDSGVIGLVGALLGIGLFLSGLKDMNRATAVRQAVSAALLTYGSIGFFESLAVFTYPTSANTFISLASPIPWLLLGVAESERIRQRAGPSALD